MLTFDYGRSREVVGRGNEMEMLQSDLGARKAKIVILEGPLGIGKTAIANRILEIASAGALSGRFSDHLFQSAYQETWGRVLTQIAIRLIGGERVHKATQTELEDRIIAFAMQEPLLLVIDNVEEYQLCSVVGFIAKWSSLPHRSVLLITSRHTVACEGPAIVRHELSGLSDRYAQLALLGEQLRNRFTDDVLQTKIACLNGIPLSLIYLRWLDPKTVDDLDLHVNGLVSGTVDKLAALEDVMASLSRPPTHFMALGVLRRLQLDEKLLAFLWDRLGGGNSQAYVELRDQLVTARLLIPLQEPSRRLYRISEDIHAQLYRALVTRIGGEERSRIIHFFIAEYYRRLFETTQRVDALEEFIFHCFGAGESARAYSYVIENDRLASLHQAGAALQIYGILEEFQRHADLFTPVERCRILVEKAHASNDLSQFDACLALMSEATALLSGDRGDAVADGVRHALWRRIWYYSAVAYSNTGHSIECLQSYFRLLGSGESYDQLSCLALSYLSHDLKYRDLDKAVKYGQIALKEARRAGDKFLIAKCLCGLAESYYYQPTTLEAADASLNEAWEILSQTEISDRRELGRVLKNWGVVSLLQRNYELAGRRLDEGRATSASVGDRRRVATADLYLSLLQRACGEVTEALPLLRAAIAALFALGDGRYLVPAVLTYAVWQDDAFSGRLEDLSSCAGCADAATEIKHVVAQGRFEVYADFWRLRFRSVLLRP